MLHVISSQWAEKVEPSAVGQQSINSCLHAPARNQELYFQLRHWQSCIFGNAPLQPMRESASPVASSHMRSVLCSSGTCVESTTLRESQQRCTAPKLLRASSLRPPFPAFIVGLLFSDPWFLSLQVLVDCTLGGRLKVLAHLDRLRGTSPRPTGGPGERLAHTTLFPSSSRLSFFAFCSWRS